MVLVFVQYLCSRLYIYRFTTIYICWKWDRKDSNVLFFHLNYSSNFMSGILTQSYQTIMQWDHFSLLQHETGKLRSDIEKMRSELRFGFIKILCNNFFLIWCKNKYFLYFFNRTMTCIVTQVWNWQSHCYDKGWVSKSECRN